MSPLDWSVGKSVGHFLDWLVREGPAHSGQCHPCGWSLCKTSLASHGEQAQKQPSSMASALLPALLDFLPSWLPSGRATKWTLSSPSCSWSWSLPRQRESKPTLAELSPVPSRLNRNVKTKNRNKYKTGNGLSKPLKREYVQMNWLRFCEWRKDYFKDKN